MVHGIPHRPDRVGVVGLKIYTTYFGHTLSNRICTKRWLMCVLLCYVCEYYRNCRFYIFGYLSIRLPLSAINSTGPMTVFIGFIPSSTILSYNVLATPVDVVDLAVSTLHVRSRKLSNVRKGHSSDGWPKFIILSSFGRYVKLLVPVAFALVSTQSSIKDGWRQAGGGRS
jgi:hypothetical protein